MVCLCVPCRRRVMCSTGANRRKRSLQQTSNLSKWPAASKCPVILYKKYILRRALITKVKGLNTFSRWPLGVQIVLDLINQLLRHPPFIHPRQWRLTVLNFWSLQDSKVLLKNVQRVLEETMLLQITIYNPQISLWATVISKVENELSISDETLLKCTDVDGTN